MGHFQPEIRKGNCRGWCDGKPPATLAGCWHRQQPHWEWDGQLVPMGRDGRLVPMGWATPASPDLSTISPPSTSSAQHPQQLLWLPEGPAYLPGYSPTSALVWVRTGENRAAAAWDLLPAGTENCLLKKENSRNQTHPCTKQQQGKVWWCEPALAHREQGRGAPGTDGGDGESC